MNGTEIISYIPTQSPIKLDVMKGERYYDTVRVDVAIGVEYAYEEMKSLVRMLRPSLKGKEFDILPCGKPRFVDNQI